MRDPDCRSCPLHENVWSVCIESEGPVSAKVLFLGEAPGHEEDEEGRPFVGRAGRKLREYLERYDLEARIANAVRCNPPGNRKPKKDEMKACWPYLADDLREMNSLQLIVALGEIPMRMLGVKGAVLDLAGKVVEAPLAPAQAKVLVLAHPSHVLRNPAYEANWRAHWDVLKNLLGSPDDPADKIGARILDRVEIPE